MDTHPPDRTSPHADLPEFSERNHDFSQARLPAPSFVGTTGHSYAGTPVPVNAVELSFHTTGHFSPLHSCGASNLYDLLIVSNWLVIAALSGCAAAPRSSVDSALAGSPVFTWSRAISR